MNLGLKAGRACQADVAFAGANQATVQNEPEAGEASRLSFNCAMLTRIVYASHARAAAEDDIPAILAWSRRVNPGLGVTGVLCFLDGVYMQYLEGEEAELDALFASIRTDARHHDVTLLERRAVPGRAFCEWAMALLAWDDNTRNIFRSFSPGTNLDLYASDPSTSAPLVRALTRGAGWKLAID